MNRDQIIATINEKIAAEFEIDESTITPDAVIYDTLDLDSISLLDVVSIVQVTYRIRLEKTDLESIKTFADLYDFIEAHL